MSLLRPTMLNATRNTARKVREASSKAVLNTDPRTATPEELASMQEKPFKTFMEEVSEVKTPWDINKSAHEIYELINTLPKFERDIVKKCWSAHRSLGSDNHIAHKAVCQAANITAAALEGIPYHQYSTSRGGIFDKPFAGLGEGNTLVERFVGETDEISGSPWGQLGQGRFGVSPKYARLILGTIKYCQGAKPRDGGKLPGVKNNPIVASARNVIPGIDLFSPAPQHDQYSIEDLKSAIHMLRTLGPLASVKIVTQPGVDKIAIGIAKAGADVIELCSPGGGTGATTEISRSEYGMPMNIRSNQNIIYQVHEALTNAGFRENVLLYVDGQMRTPEDATVAFASGADAVGFGTATMIFGQGCIKADICHTNECPVGIQTWDPSLMKKLTADPARVVEFYASIARGTADNFRSRGIYSLEAAIGSAHILETPYKQLPVKNRKQNPKPEVSTIEKHVIETLTDSTKVSLDGAETSGKLNLFVSVSGELERSRNTEQKEINIKGMGFPSSGFAAFAHQNLHVIGPELHTDSRVGECLEGKVVIKSVGDSAFMGANPGAIGYLQEGGDRFGVTAKGGTFVVGEKIGQLGLNYVFGGQYLFLGDNPVGPGFGAAYTNGDVYMKSSMVEQMSELFHPDSAHLNPLPITEKHADSVLPHLEEFCKHFGNKHEELLSQELFRQEFVRYNPLAQKLAEQMSPRILVPKAPQGK